MPHCAAPPLSVTAAGGREPPPLGGGRHCTMHMPPPQGAKQSVVRQWTTVAAPAVLERFLPKQGYPGRAQAKIRTWG
jgi:hypothetical protein